MKNEILEGISIIIVFIETETKYRKSNEQIIKSCVEFINILVE